MDIESKRFAKFKKFEKIKKDLDPLLMADVTWHHRDELGDRCEVPAGDVYDLPAQGQQLPEMAAVTQ